MKSDFSGKKILITGGSGFIGSHAAEYFISRGAEVLIISERKDSSEDRIDGLLKNPRVHYRECSVTDTEAVRALIKESCPEYVIHCAAKLTRTTPFSLMQELYEVNVRGTQNLVQSLLGNKHLKRFVHIGTIEECAGGEAPFDEKNREIPVSPYSLTKLAATKMVEYASRREGFPGIVIRPTVVYGPSQKEGMFIPDMIHSCLRKEDFSMTGGTQTRDFLFVGDLVGAIAAALTSEQSVGEIFHIGSGESVPVREVALRINELMGGAIRLNIGALEMGQRNTADYSVNIRKARKLFGWKPEVSLDEGLLKTIRWYEAHVGYTTSHIMCKKPVLSLVMPAFNEAAGIARTIDDLDVLLKNRGVPHEIIVVENGSTDFTAALLKKIKEKNPSIIVVSVFPNKGYGNGILEGLKAARGDILGWIDADGQIDNEKISDVYYMLVEKNLDVCKGIRTKRNESVFRGVQSAIYNVLFKALFRAPLRDINAKPKFFTRAVYERAALSSRDWFIDAELVIKASRLGYTIGEVPLSGAARRSGASKVRFTTAAEFIKNLLWYRFFYFYNQGIHGRSRVSERCQNKRASYDE